MTTQDDKQEPGARPTATAQPGATGAPSGAEGQRDALMESERQAAERQPDSFMERAVTDKVVGIPPVDSTDTPIEGLDPEPK